MTYLHHVARALAAHARPLSYTQFLKTRDLIEGATA